MEDSEHAIYAVWETVKCRLTKWRPLAVRQPGPQSNQNVWVLPANSRDASFHKMLHSVTFWEFLDTDTSSSSDRGRAHLFCELPKTISSTLGRCCMLCSEANTITRRGKSWLPSQQLSSDIWGKLLLSVLASKQLLYKLDWIQHPRGGGGGVWERERERERGEEGRDWLSARVPKVALWGSEK